MTQEMAVYPITAAVRSESRPGRVYEVHLPWCPCEDFSYRRTRLLQGEITLSGLFCKHLRKALEAVGGLHLDPQPLVIPGLPHDEAVALLTSERVQMRRPEARAVLSALTTRRTERSDFNGTAVKGFVTYDPARSRFEVTILP